MNIVIYYAMYYASKYENLCEFNFNRSKIKICVKRFLSV